MSIKEFTTFATTTDGKTIEVITPKQAAEIANKSKQTIYNWVKNSSFETVEMETLYIVKKSFIAFLAKGGK